MAVHGYKGATAKGLTRTDNNSRAEIIGAIQNSPMLERLVFNFGNVDVQLSYYYCAYGANKKSTDLKTIANEYVDFVASTLSSWKEHFPLASTSSLSRLMEPEVVVLGVYPSAPEDEHLRASLVSYGTLSPEEAALIPKKDALLCARQARVKLFNAALRERCRLRGVGYADAVEEMTEPGTGRLREAYRDVSDHNIHVVWETTVLLWMRRWPWYRRLAPIGLEAEMVRSLAAYTKTKPWAERTHVAERIGVHAAVEAEDETVAP